MLLQLNNCFPYFLFRCYNLSSILRVPYVIFKPKFYAKNQDYIFNYNQGTNT